MTTSSGEVRILVIENSPTDPVGRLGDWLTDAGATLSAVSGDELPTTLDGYDGVVVLGGPMGANDDVVAPWLPHERALMRAAVIGEVPTLAICLGHQVLAAGNGGRVVVNPDGPELGAQLVAKRSAAASDPLFATLPITPDVYQWHFDTVATLPPGAVHLASSPICDNQAFRLGRLAWGIQFHIEATLDVVRNWAEKHQREFGGLDVDLVLRRAEAVYDDIAEVWAAFTRTFVDIVRDPPSVPAPESPRESIAAPVTDPAAIRAALAAEANAARMPPGGQQAGQVWLPMPGPHARRDSGV